MSRLTWGDPGTRRFEGGIDHGVLYPETGPGVAWNGLVSIQQKVDGSISGYYVDGTKFDRGVTLSDFAASLKALTTPHEFGPCDGIYHVSKGLFIDKQPRLPFGLSYRTLIGNDVVGFELGYKLHLVYNATATPADKGYESLNASPSAAAFSWDLTTVPVIFGGHRPSAHFVIDSQKIDPATLAAIEDILYGTDLVDPRLPMPEELAAL